VLAGLTAVALVKFPLANLFNIPPSWIGLVLMGGAAWVAVKYGPRRAGYRWR